MKSIIFAFIALVILVVGATLGVNYIKNGSFFSFGKTAKVSINNTTFTAEIADTAKKQEIGLSEKTSLDSDKAMLFPFGKPYYYRFWMKNMKFPLDIIYIQNNKIVEIFEEVKPPTNNENPEILVPKETADTVLEINAGLSKQNNIKTGDEVKIQM